MNRNKLLVVSGAILISIFIALVFWIQTGLNGLPNDSDIKVEYKLVFLQKLNITNEEVLSEIVEPLAISTENPLNKGKIIFCSIGEMNSIKNPLPIAPIVGMNYFRYNFMSKGMYSFKDRIQDDRLFFEQLKTDANFTNFLNSVRKKQIKLNVENLQDEINGEDVFLVNPNFTGKEKGIYQSIKEVKDYISKKQNLYNNDKQINVKIFIDLNGPETYDKSKGITEQTIEEIIEEEDDSIVTTSNNGTDKKTDNGVNLDTDRKFTWEDDASSKKIRISISTLGISIVKTVNKNQKIDLSNKEKEQLLQVDDPKTDKISIQYLNPNTNKYSNVNVVGLNGSIHCFNFFDKNEN
jgi:hypothetical protein